MKIRIITLFPEMFRGPFSCSILGRAQEKGTIEIEYINLRDFGVGPRRQIDDTPYGGGPGMIIKVDVMAKAIESAKKNFQLAQTVLLTPQGKVFNQETATNFAAEKEIIFICGHYEGFDERIRTMVDHEVSIGKYILTGGEIPAMVIVDSISRLVPGVLGQDSSSVSESFSADHLLEYPQYTRPDDYNGQKVPNILKSGNHHEIENWRASQASIKSKKYKKIDG
ncbi:MAG: tRNA (guanosine(37)-N1)-methyltransferase TrmD [bacterium]